MLKCFDSPIECSFILQKKKKLKKLLLQQDQLIKKKIAILGGSTTAELVNILELFLLRNGIEASFYQSEYNRFAEELLFDNQQLQDFAPDLIYLHTTTINLQNLPTVQSSLEEIKEMQQDEIDRFQEIWQKAMESYNCPIIQNNFEYPSYRVFGNSDRTIAQGKINYIDQINRSFTEAAQKIDGLYINDINYLSSKIGLDRWFDPQYWYSYKYAVSFDAIPYLAQSIAAISASIYGKSKKCLILDLDNTLWGGVIGDDGLTDIKLGPDFPMGEAYLDLQKYVASLKDRGIALAICSKNEYENAIDGLTHPHSALAPEDFVTIKANWNPKHQNVVEIAQELNIGLDSLVFLDDNPSERELVKSQLPEVAVPDIGKDITHYPSFLEENYFFESTTFTQEDLKKTSSLKDNLKRVQSKSQFKNYGEFLDSLEMKATISNFQEQYLERITQLINKTNQFNLTTKRLTATEVQKINYNQQDYLALCGRLEDKFGDNGLIAISIGKIEQTDLYMDIWLMSCRVIKRDMEKAMMDQLVEQAKKKGIKTIWGKWVASKKNKMVENLYQDLGFSYQSGDQKQANWKLEIDSYHKLNNHIKIEG